MDTFKRPIPNFRFNLRGGNKSKKYKGKSNKKQISRPHYKYLLLSMKHPEYVAIQQFRKFLTKLDKREHEVENIN